VTLMFGLMSKSGRSVGLTRRRGLPTRRRRPSTPQRDIAHVAVDGKF
jgi:hypothetical protein